MSYFAVFSTSIRGPLSSFAEFSRTQIKHLKIIFSNVFFHSETIDETKQGRNSYGQKIEYFKSVTQVAAPSTIEFVRYQHFC